MKDKTVAVIGGGAAGMMAAGVACKRGLKVILIEKNNIPGKKLRITGKGRCNITNMADGEEFFDNIPTNSKFLYSAYYGFTNLDTVSFFEGLGLKTKLERGGRVFPESDKAREVAETLIKHIQGVTLMQGTVKSILTENGRVTGIALKDGRKINADSVIVATGGLSYPLTGSTGDGYRLAKAVGHTVIEPKPSLVPIEVKEKWISRLMGLSLRNVAIRVVNTAGKDIYTDFGEMLFSHFGITGPVAISASSHMKNNEEYKIFIDLKPALNEEMLNKRIMRDFEKFSKKQYKNSLDELLPKKLIPTIINLSGIPEDKPVNSITKEERKRLTGLLKNFELTYKGLRPIEEAIITSGGICTREINPSTMESKLVSGLFFAGEVIDVDGYTGGFNLQIAFSTGHLAGESC